MAVLEVAQAETVAKFTPLRLCLMEMTPAAMSIMIFGMKNGLNLGVPSPSANSET